MHQRHQSSATADGCGYRGQGSLKNTGYDAAPIHGGNLDAKPADQRTLDGFPQCDLRSFVALMLRHGALKMCRRSAMF